MRGDTLNQNARDWYTRPVTLSETKGLAVRFFAEFILSEAEGLRMIRLNEHVRCTNVRCFDLDALVDPSWCAGYGASAEERKCPSEWRSSEQAPQGS